MFVNGTVNKKVKMVQLIKTFKKSKLQKLQTVDKIISDLDTTMCIDKKIIITFVDKFSSRVRFADIIKLFLYYYSLKICLCLQREKINFILSLVFH